MRVRLETAQGHLVGYSATLPFGKGAEPDVIFWGERTFLLLEGQGQLGVDDLVIYREGLAAVLLMEPQPTEPSWDDVRASISRRLDPGAYAPRVE